MGSSNDSTMPMIASMSTVPTPCRWCEGSTPRGPNPSTGDSSGPTVALVAMTWPTTS
jgi:hypothetical protein